MMPELETVRWHCHGKKTHKTHTKHKAHGCTPVKHKKTPGRMIKAKLRPAARHP